MNRKVKTVKQRRRHYWKGVTRGVGMFYADDAGVTWRTHEGLARMTAVIVTTFQEFGLMGSASKTETMCLWSEPSSTEIILDIQGCRPTV